MVRYKNLIGEKYGRLTILCKDEAKTKEKNRPYYKCSCECGNEVTVVLYSLTNGHTSSCGCLKKEQDAINIDRTIHNESHSRLWRIWKHMQKRGYGEEYGLAVCGEWLKYEAFRDWALANGYKDDLTIERLNVRGNYEPQNCEWIPRSEQLNNTTRTLWYELDGVKMSLMQAYRIIKPNLTYQGVKTRYNKGIRDKEELFSSQYRGNRTK